MNMEPQSTQSKIDNLLGITGTIDDFLDTLSVDTITDKFKEVDSKIHTELSAFDENAANANAIDDKALRTSLQNIDELIDTSKQILKHVHSCIVTTDLCDSELIQAFSKLLEAAHVTISEYISLYKNRLNFYDKLKMVTYQHNLQMKRMELKHQQDLEKMRLKNEQNVVDVQDGQMQFDQNKIIDVLDDIDNGNLSAEDNI